MKKKLLISALAVLILALCSIVLLACNTNDNGQTNNGSNTDETNQNTGSNVEVKSIYLNKNELTLLVNDSETLTVTYLPTNATNKTVNWTSTNPTIATVENGTVTGINTGTTKIIVSTTNGVSDVCTVNVSPNEFTVTFDSNGGTLINGDLVQQVQKGKSATAPNLQRDGYGLSWDKKFDNITENITVKAVWTAIFNFENGTITGLTAYGLSLTDIEVPSTIDGYAVRTIADSAFANDINLKSIVIPQSVTTLGSGVYDSTPNGIVSTYEIGGQIFDGCSNLESLTLPFVGYRTGSETLCVLGYLFGYNQYQGSIQIEQQTNAGQLGNCNFKYYIPKKLTSVTVTGNEIPKYAFENCSNLTNIIIGNNVTSIGTGAFKGCGRLSNITIPKSVTSIGGLAFVNCGELASINVENGNSIYSSMNNCLIETKSKKLILGCKNSEIPNNGTITSIGANAFNGCTELTSLTIPTSMTVIDSYAFYGFTGLTNIEIPESITDISHYAFYGCTGLKSITIPNSVTSIGTYAFSDCNGLTSVVIGKGLTSISMYAFSGCSELASITIPTNISTIGKYAFSGCSKLKDVIFLNTTNWQTILNGDSSFGSKTIPSGDLLNTATAASYLTVSYVNCVWKRT